MNKIKKIMSLLFFGAIILINIQFVIAQSIETPILEGGGGNTCYSTWKSGGSWNFVKCLGCTEQSNAKNMTDPGSC